MDAKPYGRGQPWRGAVEALLVMGPDPHRANNEGTSVWDLSWSNAKLQRVLENVGVGAGTGATGSGRPQSYGKISKHKS